MTRKKIIAVVGMPGAGKTTACNFFKKKGVSILRFGDETDLGLKAMGKQLNEENERLYRENLRKELGMAAYAIKIKPRIDEVLKNKDIIVLDGLYSWEEYEYLKTKFDNLSVLCVYAAPATRYKRLCKRKIRSLTTQEARTRDIAELLNLHKGPPIALADYLVKNEKNVDDLNNALEELFKSWQ